jgi:sec-independent protein translocase protein TatB
MFDVGFSEIMVIAVVALIVIGPERLPKVARTVGHLVGRLQRYVNEVKSDISREMELEELRKFKDEFEHAAHSVQSDMNAEMQKAESSFNDMAAETSSGLRPELPNEPARQSPAGQHRIEPPVLSGDSKPPG